MTLPKIISNILIAYRHHLLLNQIKPLIEGKCAMTNTLFKVLLCALLTLAVAVLTPPVAADQSTAADSSLMVKAIQQKAPGDFDSMAKRRLIRVLTVFNPMFYYLDKGDQKGIVYEGAKLCETFVNKKLKTVSFEQ